MNNIKITTRLLDFFFPPKCPFCGARSVKRINGCCEECQRKIRKNDRMIRLSMGKPNKEVRCFAPFVYEGAVRRAILGLKFQNHPEYASLMGRVFLRGLGNLKESFLPEVITSVPLSKESFHSRGYNQAALLAKALAKEWDVPYQELLCKVRHNQQQHTLSMQERRSNVLGAYKTLSPQKVQGKRILLVDDIVTTGNTLRECSKMLLQDGAEKVFCTALAVRWRQG